MAEVVVFHHAQGLTDGVRAFADGLRAAGHTVHTPDLYEGRTFTDLADGIRNVQEVGFDTIIARGRAAAEELPAELVYIGFSLGVLPAQMLAQTRSGAQAAVLIHSCVPPSEFGTPWPDGLPGQVHIMEQDPEALPPNGDLADARALADSVELFLYPGDRHLFADNSLPGYDEAAAALLRERVLALLMDAR
jgi:dienelactone hydrolase